MKLSSRLGHVTAEVKAFVADRVSLAQVHDLAARALDAIFPPHGFDDGDGARQGVGLSAGRWAGIRFLDGEGCDMCARPFEQGLHFGLGAHCDVCERKPFPFRRTRAACLYGDVSRDIILTFKHGDRLDVAPMLTRWLERAAPDVIAGADAVVPVPLHPFRLFRRRYNQAAELARPLARHAGLRFMPDALRRTRMTAPQGQKDRHANVKGAFLASSAVDGRRILLVDDVMTTGATASACAEALLKAGAVSVDVAVLARAVHTGL